MELDPSTIYFTHSKIRKQFSGCNKLLSETLDDIVNDRLKISDLPMITVIYDPVLKRYYSMNNRRLWVFKQLQKLGKIQTIQANVRSAVSNSEIKLGKGTLSLEAKCVLK